MDVDTYIQKINKSLEPRNPFMEVLDQVRIQWHQFREVSSWFKINSFGERDHLFSLLHSFPTIIAYRKPKRFMVKK